MKRTLALVLALVMAIGLMAFPVSADFTDDADIKYTEAVDVMSAIGVIDGFEDGSFDPDGYLTREQAAKVVAYLMLGAEDADALSASSAPFDDVAANRWSAGYIAYCVNEGIINGRSDTTFDPTGNVTGYEFAKLMLGCLGYDGAIEKYTGAEWNINVAKTALTVGLFTGNKGANYNVPLTREEAALYAFNMIQADLVDYDNRGSEIDLGNGVTINTGASKAEPITTANESSSIKDEVGSKTEDNAVWTVQFAERYFEDLEKNTGDNDAFGRPSTEWTYDRDDIGTYSDTADFTYTTGTKGKDIYSDLNKPSASKTEYNYFVDGEEVSDIGTYYEDFAIASGNDDKIGGNGTLIEVYEVDPSDNDKYDEAYNVVVINTYVGQIVEWTEADEDDDVNENVEIEALSEDVPALDDNTFETTKFDEDDADDNTIVIYTVGQNSDNDKVIISVDAAEVVTATPTRSSSSSFVAGGETYKYSEMSVGTVGKQQVDDEEDLDLYLDSYGYVIYVDAEGSSEDDYAYVIATDDASGAFEEGEYVAKLLLANGEIVVVDIDEKDSKITNDADAKKLEGTIVTYTVDRNDEYTLTAQANDVEAAEGNTAVKATGLEIKKGTSRFTIADKETATASSKTVFFVYDGTYGDKIDDDEFNAYTGIKNVPSIDGRDHTQLIVVEDSETGRAAAVFVAYARTTSNSSDDITAIAYDASDVWESDGTQKDAEYDSTYGSYYEFDVVTADGSVETMMFADDLITASSAFNSLKSDAIFVLVGYSVDDEGVVTDIVIGDTDDDVYTGKGTVKAEDDLIGLDGHSYTYSDDCVVYRMNDKAKWRTSSVSSIRTDSDDRVGYVLDSDEVVTHIFIREVEE